MVAAVATEVPPGVLAAYGLESAALSPILMGNINRTFLVRHGETRAIVQKLNPIFGAEVHLDILAVTEHLANKGLTTPRLLPTRDGQWWTTDAEAGVWRVLSHVDGTILSAGATAEHCRAAGRLLGRFHVALADLNHDFHSRRPGVHDTARHRRVLDEVLVRHVAHPAFGEVQPVADAIAGALDRLAPLDGLPARVVHGDPKLNNVVFDARGEALCLIDLDTLGRMPVAVELGDAFRSWCNPTGEDQLEATFDLERFAAGLEGYAAGSGTLLPPEEITAIPRAVEIITLELAARFGADALAESYFGWDARRFPTASAHNLHRARVQLALAQSIAAQRTELERLTAACWAQSARQQNAPGSASL